MNTSRPADHSRETGSKQAYRGQALAPRRRSGFTLLEFVGVLAILAIMAAFMIPAVVKRVDIAAWNKENADLIAIKNALVLQILRSNSIPDQTSWAAAAATWTTRTVSNITTNNRGYTRAFLIDPNLNLPRAGGGSLPYSQTNNAGLSSRPVSARLILVSSIARTNPPVVSGVPSSASFNDLWNTPPNVKPATWSGWPGTGEDICIQRINLEPTFYQLILVNRDASSTNGQFSINGTGSTIVTNGAVNSYFLDGSVLSLYNTNGLSTRFVLKRNISFVFENGVWSGQITDGNNAPKAPFSSTNLVASFAASASAFFNAAWNSGAGAGGGKGSSQSAVIGALSNFMLDYSMWANMTPSFSVHGAAPLGQVPIYQLVTTEAGNLNTYTGNGNWGLLK